MRRVLLPIPLLLATAAVVWTALGWPPPLWIAEYGLPGSQGPTGRVARIEGIEFVEVPPGYYPTWVTSGMFGTPDERCLATRLLQGLTTGSFQRPPGGPVSFPPAHELFVDGNEGWGEVPRPVWVATDYGDLQTMPDLGRLIGLPIRDATGVESSAAEWLVGGEVPMFRFVPGVERDGGIRFRLTPAFTVDPDQEHLVEPYLVEGE